MLPPDNLETPLLKARVTHFVVNPTWYVPHNIAVKEILPQIKANPGSLAKYGYVLTDRDGDEVNPYAVDWSRVSQRNFPYRIAQQSGDDNSLGKVVIHFPNAYSIFMHDTNYKWVFGLDERHVSHGCMRLEKPFEMIEYLNAFDEKNKMDDIFIAAGLPPKYDKKVIKEWKKYKQDTVENERFEKQENKYFKSAANMPVYIVYQTCFITQMGAVKYTWDTYKRDEKMMREMAKTSTKRYKKIQIKEPPKITPAAP